MEPAYSNFLQGMAKFERMLRDPQPQHSKMVEGYWFLLLKSFRSLGLEAHSVEHKMLLRFKRRMMELYNWPYHPLYHPTGERDEDSDRLDRRYKHWPGFMGELT